MSIRVKFGLEAGHPRKKGTCLNLLTNTLNFCAMTKVHAAVLRTVNALHLGKVFDCPVDD